MIPFFNMKMLKIVLSVLLQCPNISIGQFTCQKYTLSPTVKDSHQIMKLYIMTVHRAAMKKKEVPSSRRAEIQRLFDRYTSEQSTLQVDALLAFLQKEQMEHAANEETANTLITRYEIDETGENHFRGAEIVLSCQNLLKSCWSGFDTVCTVTWIWNPLTWKVGLVL